MESLLTQGLKIGNIKNIDTHIDSIGWDLNITLSEWDVSSKEMSKDVTKEGKILKYAGREDLFILENMIMESLNVKHIIFIFRAYNKV